HQLTGDDDINWESFKSFIDTTDKNVFSDISKVLLRAFKESAKDPRVKIVIMKWMAKPFEIQKTDDMFSAILILDMHPDMDLRTLNKSELETLAEFYKSSP